MIKRKGLPRKRRPYRIIVILIVIAALIGGGVYWIQQAPPPSKPKVGVIEISGVLTWDYVHQVEDALHNSSIKAVVLKVNSPGGSVSASFGLEEAVSNLADKKPVVTELEAYAYSGAYLGVSPSDFIYTHEATYTGGLGVIAIWVSYEEYFENHGIEYNIWRSGKQKDLFAIWRGPTKEENALIRSMIEDIAAELFEHIENNRPQTKKYIKNLDNAEVVEGYDKDEDDALDYKLVDDLGSYHDALEKATDLADLEEGEYKVVNLSE